MCKRLEEKVLNIHEFQEKLNQCGYKNAIVTPDPNKEFTQGQYGTLVYKEGDPELEIVVSLNLVVSLSVSSIEEMTSEQVEVYISRLNIRRGK